ncbi:MAG: glycosyltransferase, partial [Thermoproteota archaeon]
MTSSRVIIVYAALGTIPGMKANTIQTVRMCEGLASNNCSVYLLIPARFRGWRFINDYKSIKKFYGLRRGFTIIPSLTPLIWTRIKKLNNYLHLIAALIHSINTILLINILRMLTRKTPYIYVRIPLLLTMLHILRPLHNSKIIYEVHNLPYEIQSQGKLKKFFLRALKDTYLLVCISRYLAEEVKRLVGEPRRIITLHDAFPNTLFGRLEVDSLKTRQMLRLPLDKYIVAYVGSLQSWKKPEFLIDAASHLKGEDILLLIVGGSPSDLERVKRYAVEKNVKNIEFKGFVEPHVAPYYMNAADLLVHYTPSTDQLLKSYSPIKIFEYMAAGKPILAPRQPW